MEDNAMVMNSRDKTLYSWVTDMLNAEEHSSSASRGYQCM
jgi:hypothetical protein